MALGGNDASGSITANSGSSTAPAAGSTLILNTLGQSAGSVQVEGTFVGTLILEGTVSGSATGWRPITTTNMAGVVVTTMTAPDIFTFDASRFSQVRARSTAWTSGTAVLTMIAGPGSGGGSGGGGGGGGGAVTVADGADVALGTTTDAGITTNVAGTAIGFLRGTIIQWAAFLARLPAALVGGRLDVNVGATVTPANVALDATVGTTNTEIGGLTETAPGTDTASSGLNGRLQRVAQRLTSLLGLLPAALVGGRLDVNLGAAPAAVTIGTNAALVTGSATIGAVNQGTQGAGGTAAWQVQGAGAAAAALAGNPLRQGISDGTNAQDWRQMVFTTGNAATGYPGVALLSSNGTTLDPVKNDGGGANASLRVNIASGGSVAGVGAASDGNSQAGLKTYSAMMGFNGTNSDNWRSNVDVTLLTSAARTTLQNSANITTYNCRAIMVTVDVTATVSTVSLTPSINYIDPASGKTIPLLTATTIAAAGTFTYWVNMNAIVGTPAPFTKTVQADIGRVIMINMAVGNANSQTYSIGYTLIPT